MAGAREEGGRARALSVCCSKNGEQKKGKKDSPGNRERGEIGYPRDVVA